MKLYGLLDKLKRIYNQNIDITLVSNDTKLSNIKFKINVELLSDFRIDLERREFLKILKKVKESTKSNYSNLIRNLKNLKQFYINKIFMGDLFEGNFVRFFNLIFGEYELIKKIIQSNNFDQILLFNCNLNLVEFFKNLNLKNHNIKIFKNPIFKKKKLIVRLHNAFYLLKGLIENIFEQFLRSQKLVYQQNNFQNDPGRKKVVFHGTSKNQKKSLEPIYEYVKINRTDLNPIKYFYTFKHTIPRNSITDYLRFLFLMKRVWFNNLDTISRNMNYAESVDIVNILDDFYHYELLFILIIIFNNFWHFKEFLKMVDPDILVIANHFRVEPKLFTKYCYLKNIPTLFVPHSAIVTFDELITKSYIRYFTVPGERDKAYLVENEDRISNIIVTGRPRYEIFYKGEINRLKEVKDMYSNRIYKFEQNKFTVVLTTSHFNEKTTEKIISSAVQALKPLGLINNLVIKIHPQEEGTIHKKVSQNLNVNPIIIRDYNILEIIQSSNLLLTVPSTTVLEAMVIGTPVIILDFINLEFNNTGKFIFQEEESIITASDGINLSENIKKLYENKDFYQKYSKRIKELGNGYSYYNENEGPILKIVNLIQKSTKLAD
ncbi:MAG: UDP-N-acetylglucosamine 2-epimerase [Promethearchaeota archaeon]